MGGTIIMRGQSKQWAARAFTGCSRLMAVALGVSVLVAWGEPASLVPSVTWTENLNGALSRSGNELKPVLVVFSSPNCPWCVRLKTETLAEKDVQTALEGFICVAIDTSRDPRTAQEFQVSGVPLTLILSGDGRLQAIGEGFMSKDAFLAFLDDYRKGGVKRDTAPPALGKWLKALKAKEVTALQWPDIMAGLGRKDCRIPLHNALLAYVSCPRTHFALLFAIFIFSTLHAAG